MSLLPLRPALLALLVLPLTLVGCPEPENPPLEAPDAGTDAGDEEEEAPATATGGAETSAQLQAVRDVVAVFATHSPPLPVEVAAVTYVRPQIGADPAGFFVQAEAVGPALFIAVDPQTLSPVPAVGDLVSFQVRNTTVLNGQHLVTGIEDYVREGAAFDVSTLVQDLSAAADLVTGLAGYESELVVVEALMEGDLYDCAPPSVCNAITTAGVPEEAPGLRFRLPSDVVETHGLRTGCEIRVGPSPLWRYRTTAQVAAYVVEDLEVRSCPGLRASAATAPTPTTVQITFDAEVDPSSVSVGAFTLTSGVGALTVQAAETDGKKVTLTTSTQVSGIPYTVTVATSVRNLDGIAVEVGTQVGFVGFLTPAVVRINEAELNAMEGCDLIELRVIEAGHLGSMRLLDRNPLPIYTFPEGFMVEKNALVAVHVGRGIRGCNAGGAPEDETDGPNTVAHPKNLPGAYDVWSSRTGVDGLNNSLALIGPLGNHLDFVAFAWTSGSIEAVHLLPVEAAGQAGAWTYPSGGYTPVNYKPNAVSYRNERTLGTLQRTDDADSDSKAGWGQVLPASLGSLNAGQSPLP